MAHGVLPLWGHWLVGCVDGQLTARRLTSLIAQLTAVYIARKVPRIFL